MDTIEFVKEWYKSQCNEDWEHQYGVSITTIDNPGWHVKIDLRDTDFENLAIDYTLIEKSENDWYGYSVKDAVYAASGDPSKLQTLLESFRQVIEGNK